MKKLIISVILTIMPLLANADPIEIDGFYYFLDTDTKEATVTNSSGGERGIGSYSGSIVIPSEFYYEGDGNIYHVTRIGDYAFYNCTGLTKITIPNSIISIGLHAFYGDREISSINIPASVVSLGRSVFSGCYGLNSIIVDANNPVFDSRGNCNAIIETETNMLIAGCNTTVIPDDVTGIGDYAFSGRLGLTRIVIPCRVINIGYAAFDGCTGLESIIVESGNPVYDSRDHCNAIIKTQTNELLYGCVNTTIPNTVTTVAGFYANTRLKSITIPASVNMIRHGAFAGCTALTDVYCEGTKVPEAATTFSNDLLGNMTLHVLSTAIDDYRSTAPWEDFGNIVGDVPDNCETPIISYQDGKLTFASGTENSIFKSFITCDDIASREESEVELSITYHVSVYASAAGYSPSDVATATLCWIETDPMQGIATEKIEIPAFPVLIKSREGIVTVEGLADGTQVSLYAIDGSLIGSATSFGKIATVNTILKKDSIVIVRIGEKAVKVVMN